jgi:hypothetical protein
MALQPVSDLGLVDPTTVPIQRDGGPDDSVEATAARTDPGRTGARRFREAAAQAREHGASAGASRAVAAVDSAGGRADAFS